MTRTIAACCVSVLGATVLLCAVGVNRAHAQPASQAEGQGLIQMQESEMGNDERAKAHFRVGTSLYDAGRFIEAAQEWQQAYDLSQRSELLYNVYVAYRDAASANDKAIDALRNFLEVGRMEETRRLQLEARLRAMEEELARRQSSETAITTTQSEAQVANTNVDASATPTSAGVPSLTLLPATLLIGGGVLLATAVITGLLANGVESDLEDSCPNNLCPPTVDLDSKRSTGNTLIAVNAVTLITGLLAVGAGTALWLTSGDTESTTAPSPVALGCGPSGCSAQITTRF